MNAHSSNSVNVNTQLLKGFCMGGLAGVITKTTVAPIDRVKLVLQLQAVPCNGAVASSSSCGVITVQAQQYGGIVDCFRKLCAEEGVKSLWRGNSATVVRTFPSNAMNLAFRDLYRSVFVNHVDRKKNPTRFALGNTLAGGAAGATALVFLYPLDFARTRLAVDSAKHSQGQRFNGIVQCFRTILLSEGGVHGLYKGFCASLQFTMISRAVFFGIFDTARAYLMDKSKTDQLSFMANWCLAQSAVITSSFMCYPLDTVRRRLMLESGKKVKMYRNSLDCWKKILKNESVPALYKGALSNSLRCTSGAMVLAVYYEMVKYI